MACERGRLDLFARGLSVPSGVQATTRPPNRAVLKVGDVKLRIEEAFSDAIVDVVDPRGGSNYFEALVVTDDFAGMPRIKRHRAVMALFDEELKSGIVHALALRTFTPAQFDRATTS